ncbi:hypothetical protein K443DRAFT_686172 [Laccaria amethystina LaAM-08-1]|uniref:Uncharacterized protein n=1 Tax=Laccaria amethystina LaAM-08-1 TaxID=1095629 RepID=A0A0C9WMN3_9AGAR|nr:hypothetical protein K443DRAFT_686172 [Laccaria amethystina LaAM-08-1]
MSMGHERFEGLANEHLQPSTYVTKVAKSLTIGVVVNFDQQHGTRDRANCTAIIQTQRTAQPIPSCDVRETRRTECWLIVIRGI